MLDADSGLLQNFTASADDEDQFDDEDGVTFLTPILPGCLAQVAVVASLPAKLDAWLDYNQDGDWDDPGEKLFDSVSVNAGNNVLTFTAPAESAAGPIVRGLGYARFRLSTAGGLNYFGMASDGEVEDHVPSIGMPLQMAASPGQLEFTWQDGCELYVLQHSHELDPPDWQDVASGSLNNGIWRLVLSFGGGSGYYRLRRLP
jgi:hypothetical protein